MAGCPVTLVKVSAISCGVTGGVMTRYVLPRVRSMPKLNTSVYVITIWLDRNHTLGDPFLSHPRYFSFFLSFFPFIWYGDGVLNSLAANAPMS